MPCVICQENFLFGRTWCGQGGGAWHRTRTLPTGIATTVRTEYAEACHHSSSKNATTVQTTKRWGNGSLSPERKRSLTPEGWGIVREPDTSRQGREEQVSVPIRPGACPRKERMEGVSVPTGELAGTGCRDDFVAVVEHPAALVRSRVFGAGENGGRCRGGVARLLKNKVFTFRGNGVNLY